jgi:hypothetical protein
MSDEQWKEAERKLEEEAIEAELSEDELDPAAVAQHKLAEIRKQKRAEEELAALKRKLGRDP